MSLFVVTSALLMLVDLQTSTFWVIAILVLRGVGMAFTFVPLQAATFATIKKEDMGQASSITNTNRQVASSVGVALLATVLISRTHAHVGDVATAASNAVSHGTLLAFHDAFFASAVLAAVGMVFTLIIRDADAAESMRAPVGVGLEEPAFADDNEPGHVHLPRREGMAQVPEYIEIEG